MHFNWYILYKNGFYCKKEESRSILVYLTILFHFHFFAMVRGKERLGELQNGTAGFGKQAPKSWIIQACWPIYFPFLLIWYLHIIYLFCWDVILEFSSSGMYPYFFTLFNNAFCAFVQLYPAILDNQHLDILNCLFRQTIFITILMLE